MMSELERISELKSMPLTKMPCGVLDIGRYMLHTFALTFGSEAGKSGITPSHYTSISEHKSMAFTKMPHSVWDIGRYMLNIFALTVGSETGKS